MIPFGLYVHVPFCEHKCPYCDFNTYAIPRFPEDAYTNALCGELELRMQLPAWQSRSVQSLYFGGGTPSLFSAKNISRFLNVVRSTTEILPGSEIALEANPIGLTESYLSELQKAGVNRLSLGAQSFQAHSLKILGRNHNREDIYKAYELARGAGYTDISIDLLYASPEQTLENFQEDLQEVIALQPEHVSSYCLSLEPGTPYYQAFEKGSITVPHEEVALAMMDALEDNLTAAGYEHYELSNFAKPGHRSRHNWAYWEGKDYLGLGAGAHSYVSEDAGILSRGRRWANVAIPESYQKQVGEGKLPEAWSENLSDEDRQYEFFFLGLRKVEGVQKTEFFRRFGVSVENVYEEVLKNLEANSLTETNGDSLRLTRKGRRLSDSVFGEFVR